MTTVTLYSRTEHGHEPITITISRDVKLAWESWYTPERPPMTGWMRWDKVPLDWDAIFAEEESDE